MAQLTGRARAGIVLLAFALGLHLLMVVSASPLPAPVSTATALADDGIHDPERSDGVADGHGVHLMLAACLAVLAGTVASTSRAARLGTATRRASYRDVVPARPAGASRPQPPSRIDAGVVLLV